MKNVIIIHGTGGSPERNWFPWLKTELEKTDCRVFVPKFPTPRGQSLESWLDTFKNCERYLDESAIVVGHSLGTAFLLNVLEKLDHQIEAAYFVSGFTGLLDNPEFDDLNRTFVSRDFDWSRIKRNCKRFNIINSDNDPYVPLQKGIDLAKNLGSELIVLSGAGHINHESGYLKFEFLLEKMKSSF